MDRIEIYDPAQGCSTGACGPDSEDQMAQFAASLEWLKGTGVSVFRYNLGHQPEAFVANAAVKSTIQKDGIACLPLIIVDGKIVSTGRYPSRSELSAHLGVAKDAADATGSVTTKRCCG
jgi:hypothetical protein